MKRLLQDEKNPLLGGLRPSDIEKITSKTGYNKVVTDAREISRLTTPQKNDKINSAVQEIVGKSPSMVKVIKNATKAARAKTSILLLGETGVGKSMLARIIHQLSDRIDGPFIKINCGAIPDTLIESELFGYQKGAFTGASNSGKTGLIEAAHKGTVFFDEIGELAQNMQVKLLEVIENKTFVKLGSHHSKKVDANIIAATNKNLKEMVAEKTFREDLYYRLNVFPIHIPPLRERKEDIPELAFDILAKLNKQKKCFKQISPKTIDMLTRYSFPGNVRELINIVERMFILCEGDLIDFSDLPEEVSEAILSSDLPSQKGSLTEILARIESQLIRTAVSKTKSMAEASKELGIHTTTLWRKAQKYGIA